MAYIGQAPGIGLAPEATLTNATVTSATVTNLVVTGTIDVDATGGIDEAVVGATTPAAGTFTTTEADHYRLGNVTSGASGATLVPGQSFISTAAGQTITLPASPSVGDTVYIGVQNFEDTVVARNGQPIMSTAQDLTIDKAYITITLRYVDGTIGWRIY